MKKEKSEDFTAIVISKLQTKPKFNSYKDLFIAALCVKKMDISTLYSFLKHGFLGLGENELIFFISLNYDIKLSIVKAAISKDILINLKKNFNKNGTIGIIEDEFRKIMKEANDYVPVIKKIIDEKKLQDSYDKVIHLFDGETKKRVSQILKNSFIARDIDECHIEKIFSITSCKKYTFENIEKYAGYFLQEGGFTFSKDDVLLENHIDEITYPYLGVYAFFYKENGLEIIPVANQGAKIQLEIIDIVPYKSDNLAVLNTKTSFGEYISFLDSSYWENKDKYIVGNKYYFNLCAITYSWAIRKTDPIIIKGKNAIRHYKMREMEIPYDENGKVKPLTIGTDNLHFFDNLNPKEPENYQIVAPVQRLREISTLKENFYLFDIDMDYRNNLNDEEFKIPCFAVNKERKKLHEKDSFCGNVWIQGHLDEFGNGEVDFLHDNNIKVKLSVEIADNPILRSRGFTNRFYIPYDTGMFYEFESEIIHNFVTTDVGFPLSVAYIKYDGRITEIIDRKADDHTSYTNKEPVQYVLEVNQGWFEKNGIHVGDYIRLNRKKS